MKPRNPPRKAPTKPAGGRPRQDEPMTPSPDRIEPASESEAANDADAERDRILNAGVDYTMLDPRRILAAIAIDGAAPPGARVAAAKALLLANAGLPQDLDPVDPDAPGDELTRRALALMAKGRPN